MSNNWVKEIIASDKKTPMPILSFPSISLLGVSVKELIADSDMQSKGMKAIADRHNTLASVSMMDLSVEAEAFGAAISVSDDEVPAVIDAIAYDSVGAEKLQVPEVGAARTGIYVDAIKKATELITDRPVFAGIIGPYSLAGRLMDVNNIMMECYDEPEVVTLVLEKVTKFLIEYAKAFKAAGAKGIVMAEPLAGVLSPALCEEFSEPYVKKIVDAVQTEDFVVVYHNCGNSVLSIIDSILRTGAAALHFGNAVEMTELLEKIPSDILVMGNVDPVSQFRHGTPESITAETKRIIEECSKYPNFLISSGCDIPPQCPWVNIDAFFEAAK